MERNLKSAFFSKLSCPNAQGHDLKRKILGRCCRSIPGSVPESFVRLPALRYPTSGGVAAAPMCMYKYTQQYNTYKDTAVFLWLVIGGTWQGFLLQYSCVVKPVLLHGCCSKPAWQGVPAGVVAEPCCSQSPSRRALRCGASSPASGCYSSSSSGYTTYFFN